LVQELETLSDSLLAHVLGVQLAWELVHGLDVQWVDLSVCQQGLEWVCLSVHQWGLEWVTALDNLWEPLLGDASEHEQAFVLDDLWWSGLSACGVTGCGGGRGHARDGRHGFHIWLQIWFCLITGTWTPHGVTTGQRRGFSSIKKLSQNPCCANTMQH